jgi:hypothetical protein
MSVWKQGSEGVKGDGSLIGCSLIESYVVRISYPEEGDIELSIEANHGEMSRSTVSKQAISLVRTLISLVNTLPPLPEDEDLMLSVRMYYFDDKLPSDGDWVPSHFHDARDVPHEAFVGGNPFKMLVGSTETKHHSLSVNVAVQEGMAPAVSTSAETPGGADEPDDDDATFARWVSLIRTHVMATRSASVASITREFGNQIPRNGILRVLEHLCERNVLRKTSKGRGPPQYAVLAMELAPPRSDTPPPEDDELPKKLFSFAVLVAWSHKGDYLTARALSDALGFGRKERELTSSLMSKLVEKEFLSDTPNGNRGREVPDSENLSQAVREAVQWLRSAGYEQEALSVGLELPSPPRKPKRGRSEGVGSNRGKRVCR